jgi:hypothetical protein
LMVFDGLGFLFVCLHLLHNAFVLFVDGFPSLILHIYRVSLVEKRTSGTFQNY